MVELAEMIVALTGYSSPIVMRPLPADDPRQRRPDITSARTALDLEPTVRLREGLVRTIAYFDGLLSEAGGRTMPPQPCPAT